MIRRAALGLVLLFSLPVAAQHAFEVSTPSLGPERVESELPALRSDEDGWLILLEDSFESDEFPSVPWSRRSLGSTEARWGRTAHRAAEGAHSLYATQTAVPAPGPYPDSVDVLLEAGPFDLRRAGEAELSFLLWTDTEPNVDGVIWAVSNGGSYVTAGGTSGDSEGWMSVTLDLGDLPELGSVLGEPFVYILFRFVSRTLSERSAFEGVYLDDVRLRYREAPPTLVVAPEALTFAAPDGFRVPPATIDIVPEDTPYVPGRVLVRLAPEAVARAANPAEAARALFAAEGVRAARPVFPETGRSADPRGLRRIVALTVDATVDVPALARALATRPEVEFAEPDYLVRPASDPTPNDPRFPEQWGLENTGQLVGQVNGTPGMDINARAAWAVSTGSPDVTVAVLDTGLDVNHPEFAGRVVPGYNAIDESGDVSESGSHGTNVMGILGARGNDGLGMAGVAWDVSLLPVKVFGEDASGWSTVAAGLVWAAENGADVVTMSLAGGYSRVMREAVAYADVLGAVLVGAAGNDNTEGILYPAAYPEVLAVGAMSPCGERLTNASCEGLSGASRFGEGLDVLAPGIRIVTTAPGGGYTSAFGQTSAATPFVAGVAALVRSVAPALTPAEVRALLRSTAADLAAPGYDIETGYGRIDAGAAVEMARAGDRLVVVRNTGGQPLNVTGISASAPWLDVTHDAPFTLAPGAERSVRVAVDWDFVPGAEMAEITITSNDPARPTVVVSVTAEGVTRSYAATLDGGAGWRMLAAPTDAVTPAHLAGLSLVQGVPGSYPSAAPNLFVGYTGDNEGPDRGFVRPTSLTAPLTPGRGILWYHWPDPIVIAGSGSQGAGLPLTLWAEGLAPTDPVTTTFSSGERVPAGDGFFLLGNPYAEPFCLDALSAGGGTLQADALRWENGGYVVHDLTKPFERWQGFFAQVVGHDVQVDGPLTFTWAGSGTCGTAPRAEAVRLALELEGTVGTVAVSDRAATLTLLNEAEAGWDRYDLAKPHPVGTTFAALSVVGPGAFGDPVLKAVESRPLSGEPVAVALALRTSAAGAFQLGLSEASRAALPPTWSVTLADAGLGVTHNLASGPYAFSSGPVADARRFTLTVEPRRVSAGEGAPLPFSVEAVYPNPTSDVITVAFTLPSDASVALTLYDVLGRVVRRAEHPDSAAGSHVVRLDVSELSGGIYVLRLVADEHRAEQRVTVLR